MIPKPHFSTIKKDTKNNKNPYYIKPLEPNPELLFKVFHENSKVAKKSS